MSVPPRCFSELSDDFPTHLLMQVSEALPASRHRGSQRGLGILRDRSTLADSVAENPRTTVQPFFAARCWRRNTNSLPPPRPSRSRAASSRIQIITWMSTTISEPEAPPETSEQRSLISQFPGSPNTSPTVEQFPTSHAEQEVFCGDSHNITTEQRCRLSNCEHRVRFIRSLLAAFGPSPRHNFVFRFPVPVG